MPEKTIIVIPARQIGKTFARDRAAQAEALVARLVANVTKHALAEAIASAAVVGGMLSGQTPAQTEADLIAELRRYEMVAALRRHGRKSEREQR